MSADGFFDPDAAHRDAGAIRAMLAEAGREAALVKIKALVDLIDQRIEAHRDQAAPGLVRRVTLAAHDVYRRLRRALGNDIGGQDVAEQQVLDRRDVALELGKIIFGYGHLDLQGNQSTEASAERLAAHRLCEGSK